MPPQADPPVRPGRRQARPATDTVTPGLPHPCTGTSLPAAAHRQRGGGAFHTMKGNKKMNKKMKEEAPATMSEEEKRIQRAIIPET